MVNRTYKQRNINLDLIRCLAVFCVVSVHFFLNSGFYQSAVVGKRMYVMMIMRTFFMICVPLFVILTGYLMNKKELKLSYYYGVVKTLSIYLGACIACNIYKVIVLKTSMSIKDFIISIFDFSAAPYSGYINMYIGLFLLIPFLNILYKGLTTKKHKIFLIFSLLMCTTLPSILNIKVNLAPNYWVTMYPLTYYFIGAYLKEYDLKVSLKNNILFILVSVLVFGSLNYFLNYGSNFDWGVYGDWGGFENLINAVLVFVFLSHLKLDKIPKLIKNVLILISNLALGIYLVSWIFDNYAYQILNAKILDAPHKIEYYVPMVLFVFVSSLILSMIINYIFIFINWILKKCNNS